MKPIKTLVLKSKEKVELFAFKGENGSKKILIIGVFHGEEPQGKYIIDEYLTSEFINQTTKNTLYFLPCLNPDGMKKNQRKNINGVDLNRNLPTKNWVKTNKDDDFFGGDCPASEEETKFIIDVLKEISPDIILSLHSPFGVVNYDGEAKNISEKIAKYMKYNVQADIGYPTPGSFGTYCGIERKIPTITLEYSDKEDLKKLYQKTKKVFDFLRYEKL